MSHHEKETIMYSSKQRQALLQGSATGIRQWSALALALLAVLVLSSAAFSQSVTGSISGVVTDPNGAVVPGATATLGQPQVNGIYAAIDRLGLDGMLALWQPAGTN